MSRTIDLEGIGTGDFGYKVTITGPPKQKSLPRKERKRMRNMSETEGCGTDHIIEQKQLGSPHGVVMQKTFEVSEVFQDRDLIQKRQLGNPLMQHTSYVDIEGNTAKAETDKLDWSLLDTPEVVTALPVIRKNENILEGVSY
jgi:hypothetical protein